MQAHTGITITNDLELKDMQRAGDVPCNAVIDLRFTGTDARPVEEEVLLRLRNLQVDYRQLPIDMHETDDRRKHDLMHQLTASRDVVMILTDQPEAVNAFCRDIDKPEAQIARAATGDAAAAQHHQHPHVATAGFQHSEAA